MAPQKQRRTLPTAHSYRPAKWQTFPFHHHLSLAEVAELVRLEAKSVAVGLHHRERAEMVGLRKRSRNGVPRR